MLSRRMDGCAGRPVIGLVLILSLAAGCASAPVTLPALDDDAEPDGLTISPEAKQYAAELHRQAVEVEPELTALLRAGAERLDVMLVGLEHRLKNLPSLERKIQTRMLASGLPADQIQIDDSVRYTVLLDDQPPGDYDTTTAEILRRADERGFAVVEVKNYWPVGDTYSGVNCVLSTPGGLRWELQFHTIGSLAAKDEGHHLYEELRLPTTSLRRKRQIYDRLAERWSWVQVPQGILVENSLHAKEEIILHPRP